MKHANAFFVGMLILLALAFGILIEASFNENTTKSNLYLTEKVQEQFWTIQDLQQNLSVCNWEAGNTQTIELIAPVTRGILG